MLSIASRFIACIAVVLFMSSCTRQEPSYQPSFAAQPVNHAETVYNFGFLPVHNPKLLLERYGPILDQLNAQIPGAHFRFEASRNYEEFERKLHAKAFAFVLANPYQIVTSSGYQVFAKMGDDDHFRGMILVRRDSGINELSDLKGKKIAYPSKTALAATLLPKYFLHTHGVDVNEDIQNLYVGSQESSIMNVYLGNVAASTVTTKPWMSYQREHPKEAAQLQVKWQTEHLVHDGMLARADMPPELVGRVKEILISLHETEPGKAMLGKLMVSRFEPADAGTYQVVQAFLEKFSQTVHPLVR